MWRAVLVVLFCCSSVFGQSVALTNINPKSGPQGATVAVSLTGSNFDINSTSVSISGTGVMPLSVRVTSATSATVTLGLFGVPGQYAISVRTLAGGATLPI